MTIKIGDKMPSATVKAISSGDAEDVNTDDLFKGKKVALFAVPGAYTPTCSAKHMPNYLEHADALKSKGVSSIVCLSVNDPAVMKAWAKDQGALGKITMIADGSGIYANTLGLTFDGSAAGLGTRAKRFSMLIDDGVVKSLNVEDAPSAFEVSSADKILEQIMVGRNRP
jgi:peroxiredoxin